MPKIVRVLVYDYCDATAAHKDMKHWGVAPLGRKETKTLTISSYITSVAGPIYCSQCGRLTLQIGSSLICDECTEWIDKQEEILDGIIA